MPINSVESQTRVTSHKPQQKCIHCNSVPTDKFPTFDKTNYGENTLVNQMTENDEQNIICTKCHNAIVIESLVTYITCDKTMKKMLTLKFDMEKYSLLQNTILQMLKLNRTKCYICKRCHLQLQPKCSCVCWNTDVQKDIYEMYSKAGCDLSSFVSRCLGHVSNAANSEDQYICTSCDKRLQETSNENHYGKYPHAVAGANLH